MVKKKQGLPEESELVLCTITKIYPHSVFADIDDYENKQGMIHISEISPGRIRNIHDFVKLGKKVICKVLKVNLERGHIDLSLRRVSEGQRREKSEQMKRQLKVDKIIEFVAKNMKLDAEKLQTELAAKAREYDTLHDLFEDFIADENALKELKLEPKLYKELSETIRQRIKPPEVHIEGELTLRTYAPDGVNTIKKILMNAQKAVEAAQIKYKGGGAYSINIMHDNYKDAEALMKTATDSVEEACRKSECEFAFKRIDKK
jgi:translation initiation factor 2 subunit 1